MIYTIQSLFFQTWTDGRVTTQFYSPVEPREQAEGRLTFCRSSTACTVGVKGGSEGAIILTLQLTWVVTSTKEEQSANFEPQVTKARMVFPSTKRSCLLLPVQNLKYIACQPRSLRTFLGFDDKLVPIGIADTVKLCLTYFLPSTVYCRFCQCNGCNSSQISSRPSLQTHRSSGCQRWGIVCGFRPWNTNSQWTDYYEIYPAGQFVSLVWRWILYLPSGGKLRGGSITKQGILPFK